MDQTPCDSDEESGLDQSLVKKVSPSDFQTIQIQVEGAMLIDRLEAAVSVAETFLDDDQHYSVVQQAEAVASFWVLEKKLHWLLEMEVSEVDWQRADAA